MVSLSLIIPGHDDFLLNFVSVTDSHTLSLISQNNIVFIQFPKLVTLTSLLTLPSSGILTSFSPNYFQFCQKCHSDLISKSTYESYSIGLKKMHAIWKKKKKDLTSPDPHGLFQVELAKGRPSWPHRILLLTTLASPQTDALILQNTENSSSLTSLLKTLSWLPWG